MPGPICVSVSAPLRAEVVRESWSATFRLTVERCFRPERFVDIVWPILRPTYRVCRACRPFGCNPGGASWVGWRLRQRRCVTRTPVCEAVNCRLARLREVQAPRRRSCSVPAHPTPIAREPERRHWEGRKRQQWSDAVISKTSRTVSSWCCSYCVLFRNTPEWQVDSQTREWRRPGPGSTGAPCRSASSDEPVGL